MDAAEIFKKNLRGHDYIKARGLSPEVVKNQHCVCQVCQQLEREPVIIDLINNYSLPTATKGGEW